MGQTVQGGPAYKEFFVYRYGLGLLVTVGFLLAARGLYSLISYNPLILVLTAIIIVSWSFGRGPGVMTALISAFGIRLLFFPNSPYQFDFGDLSRLLFYLLLTGFVSYLVGARRKAEAALVAANADLERRVQERTRELQTANDDLRRANADLEQFAYSASHDLVEPLRMVSVFTQLIQQQYAGKLDSEGDEYISHAVAGAKRIGSLITGLQSYITVTAVEASPAIVDAATVLAGCLEGLRMRIEESGARIEFNGLPPVRVHDIHLQLIFQNLISNAIKYRSQDAPYVRIAAINAGAQWRFSVCDNGIGIDPEYNDQIFGVFKRLHRHDECEGSGIGLAICKKIVERYGGRIWVESFPGKGSTFFFTVPGD
jgi:signal transduction histidine kinase